MSIIRDAHTLKIYHLTRFKDPACMKWGQCHSHIMRLRSHLLVVLMAGTYKLLRTGISGSFL
jgi:hypothetical protein